MAYVAGNLTLQHSSNGFGKYRYDTTDAWDTVEAAGYFNNSDDVLKLAVGDEIVIFHWTAVRTGTVSDVGNHVVTNVISNDAASSAGAVNISGDLWKTGQVSSLA